jgi:hypothetical protein
MNLSRLRSRRGVLAMSLAAALSRVVPVKAQLGNGCEYTFINGLLTIGGEECGIAVPGHMIDGTGNSLDDDTDGNVGNFNDTRNEDRQDRLFDRRDRKRDKRSRRTNQKQDQHTRRHERRVLCEDFDTQLEAVVAMSENPSYANKLDPDGDGIPCERLTPLTCAALGTEAQATSWFHKMGYTPTYDPFKLYDAETGGVCTVRGLCGDFRSQKEAVEWITNHPKDAAKLDPDGDGAPCANLTPVSCKSFNSQDEAKQWFNRNGFDIATKDPYNLYDPETNSICPERATCSDFDTQKEAVEWLTDHPVDQQRLDPDNDGAPCQKLAAVTCDAFESMEEAGNWFANNGFTPAKDPYHLYDATSTKVCPELACAKFTTQKAAIDWLTDHPDYQQVLDPNNDGLACTHLTTVKCNQFASSAEVLKWHERNNITGDPFGLFDATANPQRYCSNLPLTTNG